jgi:hypothetical protein
MEIADVRRRINETIERARRRRGLDRRIRVAEAREAFEVLLERTAVPLFRQVENVLRADGHAFTIHTPAESVRLMSDRRAEDYIELLLDTSGDTPQVLGRVSHTRASGVVQTERLLGDPATLTEHDLFAYVLTVLEPLVER